MSKLPEGPPAAETARAEAEKRRENDSCLLAPDDWQLLPVYDPRQRKIRRRLVLVE
jgi:hypothetical protein